MTTPDPVDAVLDLLVRAETPLAAHWQRRIVDRSAATGRCEPLEALLARADVTPDISAELRRHRNARVRTAWVTANIDDVAAVLALIETESRPTVLAAIAAAPSLPADALARLAAKPAGVALDLALLGHPNLPDNLVEVAARRAAAIPKTFTSTHEEALKMIADTFPERVGAMFAAAGASVTTVASMGAPTPSQLTEGFADHVDPYLARDAAPGDVRKASSLLSILMNNRKLTAAAADVVRAKALQLANVNGRHVVPGLTAALERSRTGPTWPERVAAASDAERPAVHRDAAEMLCAEPTLMSVRWLQFGWSLLGSGDLDDDLFARLAERLTSSTHAILCLAEPDAPKLPTACVAVALGALETAQHLDIVLRAAQHRGEAFALAAGTVAPSLLVHLAATGAALDDELPAIAAVLSASDLEGTHVAGLLVQNAGLVAAFTATLDESLGANGAAWEAFTSCAATLAGTPLATIAELASTVTSDAAA